jgi:hypothetical protein
MPGANKILMHNSLGDLSEMRKGKGYSCKLATHMKPKDRLPFDHGFLFARHVEHSFELARSGGS